jgi:hypothetical protein
MVLDASFTIPVGTSAAANASLLVSPISNNDIYYVPKVRQEPLPSHNVTAAASVPPQSINPLLSGQV